MTLDDVDDLRPLSELPGELAEHVRAVMSSLRSSTQHRYRDEQLVSYGLNFVHIRCLELTQTRRRSVLVTIARPDSPDSISRLAGVRDALGRANDPRIGVEYASYFGTLRGHPWASLVSTFHEHTRPLLEYVHNSVVDGPALVRLIASIGDQIARLHESGYTHGDVAPTNVIVSPEGVPHIVDLEYWQPIELQSAPPLQLGGTPGFQHPDVNLASGIPDAQRRFTWDLYGLGRSILTVLDAVSHQAWASITHYQQRALRLVGSRALDGLNSPEQGALGLTPTDLAGLRYRTVAELCEDLAKILEPDRLIAAVPELDVSGPDRIQVSSVAPLVSTDRVMAIVRLEVFQKLSQIKQLGLIELVYPTANHTRAEHALGTYAMSCEYARWLLRDGDNPLFSQLVNAPELKALLVAALLHDLGHYPLAHDFEEVDRGLFDHEARTARLILGSQPLRDVLTAPEPVGWGIEPEMVVAILTADRDSPLAIQVLHCIISGPIDADKLDYLIRDSSRTGTAYGRGIDVGRLSTTLTCMVGKDDAAFRLVIGTKEKGVGPAETVAFARYTMFRSVYWHHSYRAIKAMIQFLVLDRMREEYRASASEYRAIVGAWFDLDGQSAPALPITLGGVDRRSQLPVVEDEVLRWVVEGGTARARGVYDQLSQRRWMKRVLVQSLDRDLDSGTADQLRRLFAKAGRGKVGETMWMRKYILQARLQDAIRRAVANIKGPVVVTRMRDPKDPSQQFLDASASDQVVLLDYPDPERTLPGDLLYAKEMDFPRSKIDSVSAFEAGRSVIFADISTQFVPSIGKVRLLVREDQQDFLRHALGRDEYAKLVSESVKYAVAVGDPSKDEYFVGVPTP